MANIVKGEVALKIGETGYILKFGRNAMASAETVLGKTWPEIMGELQANPSISLIRGLLWAGLQKRHSKLSLLDVGDLMDDVTDEEELGKKLGDAIKAAFPPAKPGDTADPQRPD